MQKHNINNGNETNRFLMEHRNKSEEQLEFNKDKQFKNLDVNWPLSEAISEPIKKEKQYFIKIASNDTDTGSPFDFKVKFQMQKIDNTTNASGNRTGSLIYRKEAVVQSKFQEIASLEVVDIVVPRFIPSTNVGVVFDGFRIVLNKLPGSGNSYFICPDPGCDTKFDTVNYNINSIKCVKLTNHKESVILIEKDIALNYSDTTGSFFNNSKIYDHLVINNLVVPITSIDSDKINLPTTLGSTSFPDITLPQENKVIVSNANLIFTGISTNNITISSNKIIISNHIAPEITYSILKNNTIRIIDSTDEYYFNVDSVSIDTNGVVTIKGNEYSRTTLSTTSLTTPTFYLYSNGIRDLLDERIFYLEIDPFVPVKSTATNTQNDKMFGLLFPSTQSKQWLYLSGEPKETFLPSDYRKLDRLNVKIYDSAGNSLNNVFEANPKLLKDVYKNSIFTSMNMKIEEVERTLQKHDSKK
jgi:hypothetical protein